jgi:hypothetical protein
MTEGTNTNNNESDIEQKKLPSKMNARRAFQAFNSVVRYKASQNLIEGVVAKKIEREKSYLELKRERATRLIPEDSYQPIDIKENPSVKSGIERAKQAYNISDYGGFVITRKNGLGAVIETTTIDLAKYQENGEIPDQIKINVDGIELTLNNIYYTEQKGGKKVYNWYIQNPDKSQSMDKSVSSQEKQKLLEIKEQYNPAVDQSEQINLDNVHLQPGTKITLNDVEMYSILPGIDSKFRQNDGIKTPLGAIRRQLDTRRKPDGSRYSNMEKESLSTIRLFENTVSLQFPNFLAVNYDLEGSKKASQEAIHEIKKLINQTLDRYFEEAGLAINTKTDGGDGFGYSLKIEDKKVLKQATDCIKLAIEEIQQKLEKEKELITSDSQREISTSMAFFLGSLRFGISADEIEEVAIWRSDANQSAVRRKTNENGETIMEESADKIRIAVDPSIVGLSVAEDISGSELKENRHFSPIKIGANKQLTEQKLMYSTIF